MSSEEEYFINLSCDESDIEYDEESINTQSTDVKNRILGIKPYQFEPYISDKRVKQ